MSGHSKFAPSSMARIVQCPGSVLLAERYPEPDDSPEAREGTAAHWVLSELLARDKLAAVGTVAPNGVPVDDDMREGAEQVRDFVQGWRAHGGQPLAVEHPVMISRIHPECWGTPDLAFWAVPRGRLHVLDYKFGHGFVDAFENYQLMAYATGLLEQAGIDGHEDQNCIVHLHVAQPRNYHADGPIRTWTTTAAGLRAYVNRMSNACEEAAGQNPRLHVGTECKHCPARHACPALQRAADDACDAALKAIPLDLPVDAAGRELARVHRHIKMMEARASGLEAQVSDAIRKGQQVAGWMLEASQGREAWTVPYEQVKALGDVLGVKVAKDALITPAQARKAGLPAEVVAGFSARPSGAVKLVPEGNKAARVFGGGK